MAHIHLSTTSPPATTTNTPRPTNVQKWKRRNWLHRKEKKKAATPHSIIIFSSHVHPSTNTYHPVHPCTRKIQICQIHNLQSKEICQKAHRRYETTRRWNTKQEVQNYQNHACSGPSPDTNPIQSNPPESQQIHWYRDRDVSAWGWCADLPTEIVFRRLGMLIAGMLYQGDALNFEIAENVASNGGSNQMTPQTPTINPSSRRYAPSQKRKRFCVAINPAHWESNTGSCLSCPSLTNDPNIAYPSVQSRIKKLRNDPIHLTANFSPLS